jgi:membrane associated rhomboid family serine protease
MENMTPEAEDAREIRRFRPSVPHRYDSETLQADRRKIWFSAIFAAFFLTLIWLTFLFDTFFDLNLARFGLRPRSWEGLIGIFTAPLLHGGWNHLLSNTLPFLLLFTGTLYFYRGIGFRVLAWIWLAGGLGTWLIGRDSIHIGASGVVYGLAAFLAFSGMLRNDNRLISVSFLTIFLYGSMVWGVFPLQPHVSWESHLCGAFVGLVLSWVYRKQGPPLPVYQLEDEDADFDTPESADSEAIPSTMLGPDDAVQGHHTGGQPVRIIYILRKPDETPPNP